MRELSPDALIRAGRTAFRPDASDRERMLQSLTRTLGESALLDGSPPGGLAKSAPTPRFSVGAKLLGGLAVLAVGAALVVAPRLWTKTTPASGPAPVTSSIIPAAPPEPLPGAPTVGEQTSVQPAAPSVPDAPRPSTRSSSARSASDLLPEEVSLVSRAEQQLYAGHPDDALKTLGEHQRRFPNGALAEQRMAARVQSLCTLGRIAEARTDLTGLARAYPRSPQLDRARRFCGIDTP